VRLTELPSREYAPAWSPEGSQVIFGSTSGYASEILMVGAEGGEAVPLTDSVAHKPDFAWAPDGSRLAFTMLDSYNQGDVHLMPAPDGTDATSGGATNLTQNPAHDCCVDWAPDGERLLFLSSRQGQGGGLLLAEGGIGYQATDLRIDAGPGSDSAASSEIVRPATTVMPEPAVAIYVIDSDGGGLARLTNGAGNVKHATWSPVAAAGGERIAFVSDRDGNDEIYVMVVPEGAGAGSGEPLRLTDSPGDDSHPTWSPDGTCIAFESRSDGELGLYVMPADGSGLTKLAEEVVSGSGPSWSP
jgi:Tol biopolymer transport system component